MRTVPYPSKDGYIVTYDSGMLDYIESRNGVAWADAPKPKRRHTCWDQTRGLMHASPVARCACGAIRLDNGRWRERNSR